MIPDIKAPVGEWFDVYDLTGFAVGTRLLIQMKSSGKAMVWEGDQAPAENTVAAADGVELNNRGDAVRTTPGIAGCWMIFWGTPFRKVGRFSVQEYQP